MNRSLLIIATGVVWGLLLGVLTNSMLTKSGAAAAPGIMIRASDGSTKVLPATGGIIIDEAHNVVRTAAAGTCAPVVPTLVIKLPNGTCAPVLVAAADGVMPLKVSTSIGPATLAIEAAP